MTDRIIFTITVKLGDETQCWTPKYLDNIKKQWQRFIIATVYPELGGHEYSVECSDKNDTIELC